MKCILCGVVVTSLCELSLHRYTEHPDVCHVCIQPHPVNETCQDQNTWVNESILSPESTNINPNAFSTASYVSISNTTPPVTIHVTPSPAELDVIGPDDFSIAENIIASHITPAMETSDTPFDIMEYIENYNFDDIEPIVSSPTENPIDEFLQNFEYDSFVPAPTPLSSSENVKETNESNKRSSHEEESNRKKACLDKEVPSPSGLSSAVQPHILQIDNLIASFRTNTCPSCKQAFKSRPELEMHIIQSHPEFYNNVQVGGSTSDSEIPIRVDLETHGKDCVTRFAADLSGVECDDISQLFSACQSNLIRILGAELETRKSYKCFFQIDVQFTKLVQGVPETITRGFTSFAHTILNKVMLPRTLMLALEKLESQIESFTCEKSGWRVEKIKKFNFVLSTYSPFGGGTYIPLPYPLNEKRSCLLNIDNSASTPDGDEEKCFLWSVLAHDKLCGIPASNRHRSRIDKLVGTYKNNKKSRSVNTDGLTWPFSIEQAEKFERLNPDISLTILTYEIPDDDEQTKKKKRKSGKSDYVEKCKQYSKLIKNTHLLYNTGVYKRVHVDVLLLMDGFNYHFVLIRDLASYLKKPGHRNKKLVCRNCINCFRKNSSFNEHIKYCTGLNLQKTRFPLKNSKISFHRYDRMMKLGFVLYADFESFLPEYDEDRTNDMKRRMMRQKCKEEHINCTKCCGPPNTTRLQEHLPCGWSWLCADFDGNRRHSSYYHVKDDKEDPTDRFVKEIIDYCEILEAELKEYQKDAPNNMQIDPDVYEEAKQNKNCYFCKKELKDCTDNEGGNRIVAHHQHLPIDGVYAFEGFAHSRCNLQASLKIEFPVFIHNFQSYDHHFLLQALGRLKAAGVVKTVETIPKSSEKFLSIIINNKIKFLDSLSFTLSSLDNLVSTLAKGGTDKFKLTRQEFQSKVDQGADINLLFQKGAYPYSLMKTASDFDRTTLPPPADFYNNLKEEAIAESVYEHAQNVWDSFQVKDMGEWHDIYCRNDVATLADVIQNMREIMYDAYQLEIAHYFSIPMLAFDAVLKMSGVELDHITNSSMHCFVEKFIRGGYVGVGGMRAAKANNPFMENEYNPDEETSYICYVDANNLYGKAMSSPLPEGCYEFVKDKELEDIQKDIHGFIESTNDTWKTGFILEVDLEISPKDHDKMCDYPPAPVTRCVRPEEMSATYQQPLISDLGLGPSIYRTPKLIADLHNKNNYVAHYSVLKQYISMGVKVTRIHKVLKFKQSRWMKKFIDFNTEKRNQAKSDFEKSFWKLLNNSSFGKCIEQKRKRQNIHLVVSADSARNLTKKPTVQNIIPINETTSIFVMKRLSVLLDKPICVGASILDIAKSVMYDMHYNCMQKYYKDKCTLLYTDTDSLIYHIKTENMFQDMLKNKEFFDMSEYQQDHPFFGKYQSNHNKKVLGRFKDETHNAIITHIACPRPKMYGLRTLRISKNKDGEYQKEADGSWKMEIGECKKAKGIGRTAVKNQIPLSDYTRVIEENIQTVATMIGIRSTRHVLFTEKTVKRALSGFDSKRFAVDNIRSISYGHKDIPLYQ